MRVVQADPNARLMIAINDLDADGRDVSWLWDAPFEWLKTHPHPIWVSGRRAEDMAVRLKYAGFPEKQIVVQSQPMLAITEQVKTVTPAQTIYVLPTYTVLLEISQTLGSR